MKKIIIIMLWAVVSFLFADIEYGKYQFNEGLYDEAIIEFEEVIRIAPTSEVAQEAWHYIGRCYLEKNQFERAEDAFVKVIEGYPNSSSKDKNLYYLANVQKMNKKFKAAADNYKKLLDDFPLSEYSQRSLTNYLECYFELEEYQMVILLGGRLTKSYPENKQIPEIKYLMADAYLKENMISEGESLLSEIIEKYPKSNAKWKAIQLKIARIEKEQGTEKAAIEMANLLSGDIPRLFEEELRLQLSEYYFELGNYSSALAQLEKLKNKFNSSENLDKVITKLNFARLKLGHFAEISASYEENKKIFRTSKLRAKYELLVAEAFLEEDKIAEAEKFIEQILKYADSEKDKYQAGFLQAVLFEKKGKLQSATSAYKKLLDSSLADRDLILMRLGNIYFENFGNYTLARKYYQQIFLNSDNINNVQKAIYKSALCSETLGDFSSAVKELEQIDLLSVSDKFLKRNIKDKLNYLKKYRTQDYKKAFENLLTAMYNFMEDNNSTNLKSEIVTILSEDLKEQKQSLELISNENNELIIYKKTKILIDLANRYKLEMNSSEAEKYLQLAKDNLAHVLNETWKTELDIWLSLAKAEVVDDSIIQKIKNYLQKNPNAEAANLFRLIGTEYYWDNDNDEAAKWAESLQLDDNISEQDFALNKLKLAEYYFDLGNDIKALENYRLAQDQISLQYPIELYHFAITLNKSGDKEKAVEKLQFLINNRDSLANLKEMVCFLTDILRELGRFDEAIKYELQIPNEQRDDEFYQKISADYLALGDKEQAKKMLMYIPDKSEKVLADLAKLQFETGDLEFAEYSYKKLIEMNDQELDYYWHLGHIKFLNKKYLEAAENYKIIVDKLGENLGEYENIRQLARENVIALYRINNRPKAERIQKQFKKILTESDLDEIMLSKGVYYIDNDLNDAKKVFDKLIKKKNISTETLIAAYYWRGVVYLKMKKIEEAKSDFTAVANSVDKEFSKQAHLKLGTLNFSEENYQEALNHYYRVIESDDDGELAFAAAQNFALVCKTMEEWQKAISAYEIILERWGDDNLEAKTMFDIAFCHFRDKRYQHAIEMFERAMPILKDEETKAEAQYWIGESYYGLEQYEKAISELLKVGYNYSQFTHWAASAELRAGEAYMEMQNPAKAKQIYQRIINKYGAGSQWGSVAQKRLQNMK